MNDSIEKKFNMLVQKARNAVFFSTKEKEEIRFRVVAFMKDNPVIITENKLANNRHYLVRNLSFWKNLEFATLITKKPFFKYAFVISAFAIFLCSGIAFSAQKALPGDTLYPVKVGINEKVLSFMSFSKESKAKYDVRLVQLRLEESERIASEKKIDTETSAKITSLLNKHLEDARVHSADSKSKNKLRVSVEIHSDLEALLHAHAKILNNLAGKEGDGDPKNIQSILLDVQSKTAQINKERQDSEDRLSLQSLAYLKISAESKLKEAEGNLMQVNNLISNKKENADESFYHDAQENVNTAHDIILQGQEKLQSGEYSQAFSLFQKAVRITQETKINFSSLVKLHLVPPSAIDTNIIGP